ALSVVNNSATAVYEETTTAVADLETYTVPVYLSAAASASGSQASAITATVSFAPIAPSDNFPNFVDGGSTGTVNGSTLTSCDSSITFPQPEDHTLGSGAVTLTATSSSGLGVTYSSTTPGVCTVAGDDVSLVSVGSCSITASQAANPFYAAAADVV